MEYKGTSDVIEKMYLIPRYEYLGFVQIKLFSCKLKLALKCLLASEKIK